MTPSADIKPSNYSSKQKDGFIIVSKLKKGNKFPLIIIDDEGYNYEKIVIISKVKKFESGLVHVEFENYPMYEPFEFRANDHVLLVK